MDALLEVLSHVAPMHWFGIALAFLAVEVVTGTTYLLWPAAAAALTAALALMVPGNPALHWAAFAALTLVLTLTGHFYVRGRWLKRDNATTLNERGDRLLGQHAHAEAAFVGGVGSVKLHDTVWRAVSEDALARGERVEILGVDGATLRVKRS